MKKKLLCRLNWLVLICLLALALPGSTRAEAPISAINILGIPVAFDPPEFQYVKIFDVEPGSTTCYNNWTEVRYNFYKKDTHEFAYTAPRLTLSAEQPDLDLLQQQLAEIAINHEVHITQLALQEEWATAMVIQKYNGQVLVGEGSLLIARWNGQIWDIVFEGSREFRTILPAIPSSLISQERKAALDYENIILAENTSIMASGYKLPWSAGVSYYISRAWATGTCNHAGSNAVDVVMPIGSMIVAAREGVVDQVIQSNTACGCSTDNTAYENRIRIRHSDNTYAYYSHIGRNQALVSVGQNVIQGQPLAMSDQIGNSCGSGSCVAGTCTISGCGSTCTATSGCRPGAHLHFHVQNSAGQRLYITFDDVGAIVGCQSYTSGNNPDSIPPTSSASLFGAAGENSWYTSAVQVTLSASDNSGGSGVKLTQYRIDAGDWQNYAGAFSVSGDGGHTVYYRSQDNAGNWETEKSTTFKIDTTAPTNATSAASGCAATHNTWQNVCNDPAFTWSGAADATSGLAGYQVYWGSDPNGASATWVTSAAYDAAAASEGVTYLGVRTKDNAGNWSGWTTLFAFRYDATAPTGSLALNNGDTVTYATLVRLATTAADAHSGVWEVRFRDVNGTWSDWQLYSPNLYWQLPGPTEQTLGVETQFRDRAGNTSPVYRDTIALNLYPARPASTNYRLARSTFGASGATRISTNYKIWSTLGQPAPIGVMQSTGYRMVSGYWARLEAAQYAVYLPLVIRQ